MNGQLHFQEWAAPVAIIAFVVSATVFAFFVLAAIRTPKAKIDHDAKLPLKKDHIR